MLVVHLSDMLREPAVHIEVFGVALSNNIPATNTCGTSAVLALLSVTVAILNTMLMFPCGISILHQQFFKPEALRIFARWLLFVDVEVGLSPGTAPTPPTAHNTCGGLRQASNSFGARELMALNLVHSSHWKELQ